MSVLRPAHTPQLAVNVVGGGVQIRSEGLDPINIHAPLIGRTRTQLHNGLVLAARQAGFVDAGKPRVTLSAMLSACFAKALFYRLTQGGDVVVGDEELRLGGRESPIAHQRVERCELAHVVILGAVGERDFHVAGELGRPRIAREGQINVWVIVVLPRRVQDLGLAEAAILDLRGDFTQIALEVAIIGTTVRLPSVQFRLPGGHHQGVLTLEDFGHGTARVGAVGGLLPIRLAWRRQAQFRNQWAHPLHGAGALGYHWAEPGRRAFTLSERGGFTHLAMGRLALGRMLWPQPPLAGRWSRGSFGIIGVALIRHELPPCRNVDALYAVITPECTIGSVAVAGVDRISPQ